MEQNNVSQNSLFIGKHFVHNDFKMISKRFQNDFMPCKSVREAIIRLSNGLFTFFGNYFLLFGNYFSLFWELFFIFDGERLCKSFLWEYSESRGPVLRNKQSQWTCANGLTRAMKNDNLDVSMILYFVHNVYILYR